MKKTKAVLSTIILTGICALPISVSAHHSHTSLPCYRKQAAYVQTIARRAKTLDSAIDVETVDLSTTSDDTTTNATIDLSEAGDDTTTNTTVEPSEQTIDCPYDCPHGGIHHNPEECARYHEHQYGYHHNNEDCPYDPSCDGTQKQLHLHDGQGHHGAGHGMHHAQR